MPITTEFSRTLGLRAPIVAAAMQWVSTPPLAAAAACAGALGLLTALTQPSPDALREAIRETRRLMNGRPGKFVSKQR
jgi:NAD(P)H-dependent flavin oxidoreductase YrpB (nitropropane dioxygenase family)